MSRSKDYNKQKQFAAWFLLTWFVLGVIALSMALIFAK